MNDFIKFPGSRVSGLWAIMGFIATTWVCAQTATIVNAPDDNLPLPAQLQAHYFSLSDVRLLDGIFKENQDRDHKYLLSLDPDRLLYNFRANSHLTAPGKSYGGWEASSCKLRGHFVGHYLSACAQMYASTGDELLHDRIRLLVDELEKCQAASGYLSAFPESDLDALEANPHHGWAPYYTLHKIMAGLLDVYVYTRNVKALEMDKKMARYLEKRMARLSDDQRKKLFDTRAPGPHNEFGGMAEVLENLFAFTEDPRDLKLSQIFRNDYFLNPLAEGKDELDKLHANTHIPQVIGLARYYELSQDERSQRSARFFWDVVTEHHSFVTGGNSYTEHFGAPGQEVIGLSARTAESCNVYNMLKLTEHLFSWKPDAAYMDYYERALYNHILATIEPNQGAMTYFISLASGHFKSYGDPENAFWCCTGTGVENHARYGEPIYAHTNDTLWVNLFIPSVLSWKEKQMTLRQETSFPAKDTSVLTITVPQQTSFTLQIRVPGWASQGAIVKVNGKVMDVTAIPSSYIKLDRYWNSGDKIEVTLPMSLHLIYAHDDAHRAAILYGPLVLAGALGTEKLPPNDQITSLNWFDDKVPDIAVPEIITPKMDPSQWIVADSTQPLLFKTQGVGHPHDFSLLPLYQINHQRYAVYWKIGHAPAK